MIEKEEVIHSPSWGAAGFGLVYLLAMRVYRDGKAAGWFAAMIAGILFCAFSNVLEGDTSGVYVLFNATGSLLLLASWVYFIFLAKSFAWRTRRWKDFDDFLACQRVWDGWSKGFFGVYVLLVVLSTLILG